MDAGRGEVAVVLLDDGTGCLVPYRIDDAFDLRDDEAGAVGDYTVLVQIGDAGAEAEPVIVRAFDCEVPSFVGIGDACEMARARQEYDARVARRSMRLV